MKPRISISIIASLVIVAVLAVGSASATSYGEQGYLPLWANSGNSIVSWQNTANDTTIKSFSKNFTFSGQLDSVDVFFEFIYLRDSYLSGNRFSSGIAWSNSATGYANYSKLTPNDKIVAGNWEVVAFSVTLLPGNPGTITTSADVSYHWDQYLNYPTGGYVGSNNQYIGEYYVYAQSNTSAVPEPATLMLLGFGLIGMAVARRGGR